MKAEKRMMMAALCCGVLMAGCVTVTEMDVRESDKTHETAKQERVVVTSEIGVNDSVAVTQENGFVELAELPEKARYFALRIVNTGTETAFGEDFAQVVGGALAGAGAVVVLDGPYDLLMQFEPSFTEVAVTGEFVRMDCQVKFFLKDAVGQRLFSSVIMNYPSPGRKLGREAAKAQFRDIAAKDAAKWAAKQVSALADGTFAIRLVKFDYPIQWPFETKEQRVQELCRRIASLPGILSCQLYSDEPTGRSCIFRIVYEKAAFNAGLANGIAAKIKL